MALIIEKVAIYFLILKALIIQFWWIVPPFLLYPQLKFYFTVYMAVSWASDKTKEPIVLEIKIPHELTRPIKAMENVMNSIWGSYDPPKDWRASYFEGKIILSTSFEIAGIEGVPHFFIRIPRSNRKLIESAIYSQYPEVEIIEVPDYTKQVPMDIPNSEWDLWGTDFELVKPDIYPIKTYEQFFEERPDSPSEEKRIDPLSSLFEMISRTGKGEQMWIQLAMWPISPKENNYVERGKGEVKKIVSKAKKGKSVSLIEDFFNVIFTGKMAETPKEEESILPPEMKLTPGERDIVAAIEKKTSKPCFQGYIRYIYLAKRDVFFSGAKGFGVSFFSQFATQNLNNLKPWGEVTTKIQSPDVFSARRLYLRKRDILDKYRGRSPSFDPYPVDGAVNAFSTEELATIYHFPGKDAVPSSALERLEMKKGAPPSTLPVED
ncbi:MAG: hypothetical protein WC446_00770 [Candidatus Paceibacterota bacterium]